MNRTLLCFPVESSSDRSQSEAERGENISSVYVCDHTHTHTLMHVHILEISEDKYKGPVAEEII